MNTQEQSISFCKECKFKIPNDCNYCPCCGYQLINNNTKKMLTLKRSTQKYCWSCFSTYMDYSHMYCWNCGMSDIVHVRSSKI